MDANLIYTKTPAGEDAVRQRTRVVQRNTRMVLILVDGKSTVDNLCEKTGNPQLVESALQELERDGLIVPKLEQDSSWEQSRKVAEEIRAAAVKRLAKEDQPTAEPISSVTIQPPAAPASREPFSVGPMSISPTSVYPPLQSLPPLSGFGGEPSVAPSRVSEPVVTPAEEVEPPAAPAERRSSLFSRGDDDKIKPIRRGRSGPYISLPLAAAIAVVGVVVLAALIFMLYPYDRHRADLEAGLGRITGQSVRIGSVTASFSPRPAISLESVSIGDGEKARAARIRLVPQYFSLLGSNPAFSSIEVDGASFDGAALAVLSRALNVVLQSESSPRIGRLAFSNLQLSALGLGVGDLHGEIMRASAADPLTVVSTDRSLRVQLRTDGAGVSADFEGYGWSPVADSPYKFDSIQGKIVWDGRSLAIRGLDARIFDGAVHGTMVFEHGEQPAMAADISVKHMNVPRLATALGYANQFEGELAGSLRVAAQAQEWSRVLRGASGEGEFSLQRGSLGGIDLAEAVRRAGKGSVTGGATRYETLNGRLRVTPQALRFSDLALASGPMKAAGALDVAQDGKLAGRMDIEIRGSATLMRVPVILGATLRSPELKAGR